MGKQRKCKEKRWGFRGNLNSWWSVNHRNNNNWGWGASTNTWNDKTETKDNKKPNQRESDATDEKDGK